jgi:WD40 repeat protein
MKSPFKFLDSYTKNDRDIFFGRDREIEELYQRVFDSKILLVYGVSGTGKSSLIHCGLANKFLETDWLPIVIRRGGNIIDSMASAIKTSSITEQMNKFSSPGDFKKGVRSLYLDHYKPIFFIFDQFEELFIFGDKEERKSFIQIAKSLFESDLQCRMIFVMREEYMAGITEFEKYIPTIFSNRVRIEKMSHRNALDAIKEPCKVFNISLDEGFAESLLEKLSPGESDVELTYLQVYLDKIFRLSTQNLPPFRGAGGSAQKADGSSQEGGSSPSPEKQGGQDRKEGGLSPRHESQGGTDQEESGLSFTLSLLDKAGNVSDLLGSFLDDQIALMEDQDTALTLLKSFVSVKGTKQPMTPYEAREYALTLGRDIKEHIIRDMIQNFVNLRILCDKDQNGRYELRHDSLATKIYEKFTMAEKELLEVRKYVENAYFNFEKRGVLLNRQDLEYLETYETKLILPQNLNDFINQSKNKLLTQKHALKRITRISTVIFLLILAITIRFYIHTQQESNINAMFGLALAQSITDPVKGLNMELKLWQKDSASSQLHSVILKDYLRAASLKVDSTDPVFAIQESLKSVTMESIIINAEISKGGRYIFGWMENHNVFIHDLKSGKTTYLITERAFKHLELSDNKSLLALIYDDGHVCVYNLDGKKLFDFTTTINETNNDKVVCFSPTGDDFVAAVKNENINIINDSGKVIYELRGHKGRVNCVDISPDGRFIVTVSDDNRGFIWNYNQILKDYSVYDSLIGHNNRIWSCRFNKTGKYIITASEDSTIKIWDLNGIQVNPEFRFKINNYHFRYNNREEDEDASDPYYSKYYGRFCDALFSPGETEIIATGYNFESDSVINTEKNYYKVLFFDGPGGFIHAYDRSYFMGSTEREEIKPMTISQFVISPDEKIAAIADSSSSKIFLVTGTSYILMTIDGSYPMFSHGGGEIFWISGNKICRTMISPERIKKVLEPAIASERSKEIDFIGI